MDSQTLERQIAALTEDYHRRVCELVSQFATPASPDPLLTLHEAMDLCRVSRQVLQSRIDSGELVRGKHYFDIGTERRSLIRFDRAALLEWMAIAPEERAA